MDRISITEFIEEFYIYIKLLKKKIANIYYNIYKNLQM